MKKEKKLRKLFEQSLAEQSIQRMGKDVPDYLLHTNRSNANLFFGVKSGVPDQQLFNEGQEDIKPSYYVGKPKNHDGHVLVVGGAGSGKSSSIAIPTLETWGGRIFAIDVKGELTAHWVKTEKPAKVFNLMAERPIKETEHISISTYNPFAYLQQCGKDERVQAVRELAQAIIPQPSKVPDPFWSEMARHVLTAALLYCYEMGASFNIAITVIQITPIGKLIEEINKSDNLVAKMHISSLAEIKDNEDNKMLLSISAELHNKIAIFATDMRIKTEFMCSKCELFWDDLETNNVFMCIPEDKLGQWDGVISLMLTQLIRTLERRPDREYGESESLPPPILLLLDEFPRLGKVDVILNALATLRSKGVTICLIMQSLTQLDKIYGKESRDIIVDNCRYKVILEANDPENQKLFSEMAGSVKVASLGLSIPNHCPKNYSFQINETREPIMYPHEFSSLGDQLVLITPEGFCRVDKAPYYRLSYIEKAYTFGMNLPPFQDGWE